MWFTKFSTKSSFLERLMKKCRLHYFTWVGHPRMDRAADGGGPQWGSCGKAKSVLPAKTIYQLSFLRLSKKLRVWAIFMYLGNCCLRDLLIQKCSSNRVVCEKMALTIPLYLPLCLNVYFFICLTRFVSKLNY